MTSTICLLLLLSMVMLETVLANRLASVVNLPYEDKDGLERIFTLGCFHKHGQFCKEIQKSCCAFFKKLSPDAVNWDACMKATPPCSWDFLKTDECMDYSDGSCTCVKGN